MTLFELLKQFKKIEPDTAFTETSRRAILAHEPVAPIAHGWSAQRTLWKIFETGAAVALTGFFVLLITGAFSGTRFSPVQYSALDPQSLHAEAQAIDIQVQLANVNYAEAVAESTMPTSVRKPASAAAARPLLTTASGTTPNGGTGTATGPTSSVTSTLTIDQALQGLAK